MFYFTGAARFVGLGHAAPQKFGRLDYNALKHELWSQLMNPDDFVPCNNCGVAPSMDVI